MTRLALAVFCVSILSASASASGPTVQAVLSADTRPYQDMWNGFREELGDAAAMSVVDAKDDDASFPGARVVVTFGTKAALKEHPAGVTLIIAMAPSVEGRRRVKGVAPHVMMTPSPQILIARLRAMQPGLKRLAVVWKSEFYGAQYVSMLAEAGKAIGVEIVSVEIGEQSDIPDQLRSIYGRIDAIWVPPDALVLNESIFLLFRDFSLSNRVPLYVPIPSLVERGATASVSVSFRDLGRSSARLAEQALAGVPLPAMSYTEPAVTVLNLGSAAKAGLAVDAETLKSISRVIP